jgi:hypothetical protein
MFTSRYTPMTKKYEPPDGSKADAAHAIVRSGLGAIPAAGSAAVEFFNWLVTPPLERRRREWMEGVADGLRALEERNHVNLEELRNNEDFVDVVLHATQAAMRTSQQEKRDALRNAVLNAAAPGAPELAEQQTFVSMIDSFNEWHLRLLKLFQDPRAHAGRNMSMGALAHVLENAYPELGGKREFYDQVWRELHGRGLTTTDGLHVTMSSHGLGAKRTTAFGDRFLTFISSHVEEGRS